MTTPSSTLVLLSELSSLKHNTKVRFVGCIIDYHTSTATLTLAAHYPHPLPQTDPHRQSHSHPRLHPQTAPQTSTNPPSATHTNAPAAQAVPLPGPSRLPARTTITTLIDARLVLPPVTDRKLFEVGTWVSVIGYVVTAGPDLDHGGMEGQEGIAHVQAILLMDARSRDPRQFLQGVRMQVEERLRGSGGMDGYGDGDGGDGEGDGDGEGEGSVLGRYEKAVLARRRAGEALRESAGISRRVEG